MASSDYNSLFASMPSKSLILRFSDGTVIENDKIVQESLELEESLCSDLNVKYGSCESSNFNIRIVNDGVSFEGLWLDVYLVVNHQGKIFVTDDDKMIVTDDGYFFEKLKRSDPLKIGRYKVWSDKPTNDRVYRDLTCYDAMKDILNTDVASWYNDLTFPKTLKQLRDSLFNYLGITQETVTLTNDSYSVKGGYTTSELSCRDVIVSICEISGTFGHINREGKFEYISIPSSDTVTLSHYQNGTGAYEDYVTAKITGIVSYAADGSVGISVGTTTNQYVVQNNLILFGDEGNASYTTALTNLLNKIKNFRYRPYSVRTYGNPMMDLGTNIVINTTNQTINSFVMNRLLSGIQGMKDEYSAVGDKSYPEDVNEVKSIIKRLNGKTVSLDVDIGEISSEVVLKVTNDGKIVEAALTATPSGSAFKIKADNIDFIASNKIELTANSLEINSTKFKVTANGAVTCSDMTISGGSLNINSNFIVDTTGSLTIKKGSIDLGSGAFTVSNAGAVVASNLKITGGSITLGSTFSVTSAGVITATSGTIGGFSLDTNSIYYGNNQAYTNSDAFRINIYQESSLGNRRFGEIEIRQKVNNSEYKQTLLNKDYYQAVYYTSGSGYNLARIGFDPWNDKYGFVQVGDSNGKNDFYIMSRYMAIGTGNQNDGKDLTICSKSGKVYFKNKAAFDNPTSGSLIQLYASAYNTSSSRIIKENIKESGDEIAKELMDLNVVYFDYKDGAKNQCGLIAEDTLNVLPNIVSVPDDYDEAEAISKLEQGEFAPTMAIDYSKLTPYLVKMVQILYRELEDLKNA